MGVWGFAFNFGNPKYATGATARLLNQGSHQVRKASILELERPVLQLELDASQRRGGEVRKVDDLKPHGVGIWLRNRFDQ